MILKKITIENFKSIRDEISFEIKEIADKKCFVLLGINESGKSNILEAISLLSDEKKVNYDTDCNNKAEEKKESIKITYELEITNHEYYETKFIKEKLEENLVKNITITKIEKKIEIEADNTRSDVLWVYINDNTEEFEKYIINEESQTIEIKTEENLEEDEGGENNVLDKNKLETFLEENFEDLFNLNIPKVVFWKSSEEKYLINKPVDLNAFKEDPFSSIPLKNCFRIINIQHNSDIKKKIESIANSAKKTLSFKDMLNKDVTDYINRVWPEHKINIRFEINNMQLSFFVEEKDDTTPKYEVDQRSDGFKHFVSILLSLSVENTTGVLKNKIILLDEPEVHLHPSGEKYLRDELLKISKNNYVFFATHSIFMADKKNLDRHFSIKKKEGITSLEIIEKDNPYKEEVLYEALGTSVLEHIEANVLIFEGKTDRDIFDLYRRNFEEEIQIPNLTLISADGCNNIIKYTKFFNKNIIKGFVLFDSDKEGIEEKKKVLKVEGYDSENTFGINEILATNKKSTLEDLFANKYLSDSVRNVYEISISIDDNKPFLEQVKKQLQNLQKPFREVDKEKLKKVFFQKISKLEKEDLKKEKYYNFFENLATKLNL